MTKIEKVIRDINNLQDFYKRTRLLRSRIKTKTSTQMKLPAAELRGIKGV